MTSENVELNAKDNKECIRCKGKKSLISNDELLKCGSVKCEELSHYICFEKKYKKSSWFQDLKESNNTNEVVYCYFELEPIFKDHASIRPKLTSNELDSDTDDSEESEEDLSEDPFASTNSVESQNVNSNREKKEKGVKRSASSDMKNKSKSKFKTEHISTSKMDQYLESKKNHCETKIEAENSTIKSSAFIRLESSTRADILNVRFGSGYQNSRH